MGSLLLRLLVVLSLQTSECLQLTVDPDEVTTVTLSTSLPLDQCGVCVLGDEGDQDCSSSLEIGPSSKVLVLFNCSEPQNTISVLTESRIECNKSMCMPERGHVPTSLLSRFNRKFVWMLGAPAETTLVVDFPGYGLKKVSEGENCTDGYSYTVATSDSGADHQTQSFCRNGSAAHLELPNQATVTLTVSQKEELTLSQLPTVKPKSLQKKGRIMAVIPDPDTTVIISKNADGPVCSVCVGEGPSRVCGSKQTLSDPQNMTVEFSCTNPQDVFTVEVNRDFDCSATCSYDTLRPEGSFFPDFNRTFTWDLKVSPTKAFQLDFPAPGIRQIPSSDHCFDKHTYTILMYTRAGTVRVGTFCRNGTINRMQVLYRGRVTLEVPGNTILIPSDFMYSETAVSVPIVVDATLPREQSNIDFFSAIGIPKENVMTWNFVVPPKHNCTIRFLNTTKPQCQSKEVKVMYQQDNKAPIEKALTDEQPSNYQGNFSLSLTNCDDSKRNLFLSYRVSVFRSGFPYCCTVDLQQNEGLSLQIENINPGSFCELRMDSVVQEKIMVPAGSKADLCFLDCPSDELFLTATKTIDCQSLSSCSVTESALAIPSLDFCLPTPLRQFKWDLRVPEQGSVELRSLQGNLQQSVPGQMCDGPVSLLVSEADGSSIGSFCSNVRQGAIQKVQILSNVTVTAMVDKTKDLGQERGPFFNVSFVPEITDNLIYTVSLLASTPVLLATPNWPGAMKSLSTVSWIVTIPEDYSAELLFVNVSKGHCDQDHATVAVREIGAKVGEDLREDQPFEKFDLEKSFYLNMSNCESDQNTFSVLSKISLQKKTRKLLSIILAIVGALLVLMIIILAVVCVLVRKKKRQVNRSSIYIPKGPHSLPGDASFPNSRADNDSHVYASIDENMIYSHLLTDDKEPDHFNGHQVGTYRTFTAPMDTKREAEYEPKVRQGAEKETYRPFLAPSETFIPSRPRTPLGHVDSVGFEDRRMVDNELYTFKNPGDPNPIRLSAAEPISFPESETISTSGSDEPESHYDIAM